jgi:hypothetical protein
VIHNDRRPAPTPRGTGLHKIVAATTQPPNLDAQPTAVPVAWWLRASTLGALVWCPMGCRELHQHVVPRSNVGPVVRESRCRRGTYVFVLADVLGGVA